MSFRSKWKLLAQSSTLGMVRYTVKARRTIFYAADEALREKSNEVTPEHLLLGLLRADESIRAHLVMPTIESMRNELAANRPHERQSWLLLGRGARRVIIFAAQEREHLSHKHTGTEHLLLGIIRAGSHAAKVLQQHGITRDRVRRMLQQLQACSMAKRVVLSSIRSLTSTGVFTQNPRLDRDITAGTLTKRRS